MNKFVQIRNIPEDKHRKLKARAASKGMSISDYVGKLIDKDIDKPSIAEFLALMKTRERVHLVPSAEDLIREDRDSRS